MLLKLKVILVGECELLVDFQEMELEFLEQVIYSEFEDILQIVDVELVIQWCCWVIFIVRYNYLFVLGVDVWLIFICEVVCYIGE